MKRPRVVTRMAVLTLIIAVWCPLEASFYHYHMRHRSSLIPHTALGRLFECWNTPILTFEQPGPNGPESGLPLYLMFGLLTASAAAGLWKLRNWARLLSISAYSVGFGVCLVFGLSSWLEFYGCAALMFLIAAACGLMAWYLTAPRVREAFGAVVQPVSRRVLAFVGLLLAGLIVGFLLWILFAINLLHP